MANNPAAYSKHSLTALVGCCWRTDEGARASIKWFGMIPVAYLITAGCSVVFGFSAMLTKRAFESGARSMQVATLGSLSLPLSFLPILLISGAGANWDTVAWPLLTGLVASVGISLVYLGLRFGDASVQGPLAGSKAIFVAFYTSVLLVDPIGWRLWLGALLTTAGILWIGLPELRRSRHRVGAMLMGLGSAAAFGFSDKLVEIHAPAFGPEPFVQIVLSVQALVTVALGWLLGAWRTKVPRSAWGWVISGAVLLGLQGGLFGLMLARHGDATSLNIIYATRGLWTVVLVGAVGKHLGSRERHEAGPRLIHRFCGAILLFAAVVLVLLTG